MRALVVLLLMAPAVAGCFGGGDDALDPSAADGAGEVPTLPEGLAMDDADVVSYNETSVTWRWVSTTGPGAATSTQGNPVGVIATTSFDLPIELAAAVAATVSWQDHPGSTLALRIAGPEGDPLCSGVVTDPDGTGEVSCVALVAPVTSESRGSVIIEPYVAARPIDFELVFRLSIGDARWGAAEPDLSGPAASDDAPATVIGFADTGINPYHVAYRDQSPEAYHHPSTYIDGYPDDAIALNLSLDAPTYFDAVAADAGLWTFLEHGQLYWIPGTKIIGAYAPDGPRAYEQSFCRPILDCNGHGTWTAGRAVGNNLSLCEDCKFVEVQGYQTGLDWMAEQAWIDISALEYCYWPVREERVGDRAEQDALLDVKPTFFPSGNGVNGLSGVGMPPGASCFHPSLPNAISVGGYNDGRAIAWSDSMPRVAADVCTDLAHHFGLDSYGYGCGTSFSVAYAAGAGGAMIREARTILGDHVGGVEDRVLARGPPGMVEDGPLSDGEFTVDEFKRLLFTTADPRPGPDEHGGTGCPPTDTSPRCLGTQTTPVEWQSIPEGVPQYYFIGYGGINNDTLQRALQVLRGEDAMPERPVEDAFFALDQAYREALVEADP